MFLHRWFKCSEGHLNLKMGCRTVFGKNNSITTNFDLCIVAKNLMATRYRSGDSQYPLASLTADI